MAETRTLHDAFVDELRDTYDAERQLSRALAKLADGGISQSAADASDPGDESEDEDDDDEDDDEDEDGDDEEDDSEDDDKDDDQDESGEAPPSVNEGSANATAKPKPVARRR